jgi:hypothetical protein
MHPDERKKIEQTIAMLQEMLGQKGEGAKLTKIIIPGFDQ